MVTDSHIHIGQFYEKYYEPCEVFETVFNAGIKKLIFSSTTSCVENIRYHNIEKEIDSALKLCDSPIATPLFWFIPDYINQGIDIEHAMQNIPYGGFKLHPYSHTWTFTKNKKQNEVLHTIFSFAGERALPILIHTGESGSDSPNRFKKFFEEYPAVRVILAHGRPINQAIELMHRFDNVYCDTAFMPIESIDRIVMERLAGKAFFGSDFPITHYFEVKSIEIPISLADQYGKDIEQLQLYPQINRMD